MRTLKVVRSHTSAKNSLRIAAQVVGSVTGAFLISRYLNYHPRPLEQEEACNVGAAPILSTDQPIKLTELKKEPISGIFGMT